MSDDIVIVAHTYVCEREDGRRDFLIINRLEGNDPPQTIQEDDGVYVHERSRIASEVKR